MPDTKITVSTTVPASPDEAWRFYTTPEEVMGWNFANDDWHCPSASIDLREGGAHTARMEAKDGSFGFDFGGTYTEVDAPHALTLQLGDGRSSRTTFSSSGDGTRVETVFDAEDSNPADMQKAGWQAILDNYHAHVCRKTGNA